MILKKAWIIIPLILCLLPIYVMAAVVPHSVRQSTNQTLSSTDAGANIWKGMRINISGNYDFNLTIVQLGKSTSSDVVAIYYWDNQSQIANNSFGADNFGIREFNISIENVILYRNVSYAIMQKRRNDTNYLLNYNADVAVPNCPFVDNYITFQAAADENEGVFRDYIEDGIGNNYVFLSAIFGQIILDEDLKVTSSISPYRAISEAQLGGYCEINQTLGNIMYNYTWYRNNTAYSYGSTTNQNEYALLSNISSNATAVGDNWTFSCLASQDDDTIWTNSTVIIEDWYIDNCTTYGNYTHNFTFTDFDDQSVNTNVSFYAFYQYNNSPIKNYSFYANSINKFSICFEPPQYNLTANYSIEYIIGGDVFNYYASGVLLDIIPDVTTLIAASGTQITATVFDNINKRVEGAYIHVLRYDPNNGNYEQIAIAKTNFEGEALLYLTQNTIKYKFLVYYPLDALKFASTETYISGTTIEFVINLYDEVGANYYNSRDVDFSLIFLNATNQFQYTFSDPNDEITAGKLKVWRTDAFGNELIETSTVSSTAGTITISVTPSNDTIYLAKAYLTLSDGTDYLLDSLSHTFHGEDITSMLGLLGLLMLTIAFAFLFKFSIPLGIVAVPIPLVMFSAIGLVQIDLYVAFGVEIMAIILAIFINDRG